MKIPFHFIVHLISFDRILFAWKIIFRTPGPTSRDVTTGPIDENADRTRFPILMDDFRTSLSVIFASFYNTLDPLLFNLPQEVSLRRPTAIILLMRGLNLFVKTEIRWQNEIECLSK